MEIEQNGHQGEERERGSKEGRIVGGRERLATIYKEEEKGKRRKEKLETIRK